MRTKVLAVALALACVPIAAVAQNKPCTSEGKIVLWKIVGNDGQAQIMAETSGFCSVGEALAAGLAAGFEAQRAKYLEQKLPARTAPPVQTVAAHD